MVQTFTDLMASLRSYNPDEPRDDDGKWTGGGEGGATLSPSTHGPALKDKKWSTFTPDGKGNMEFHTDVNNESTNYKSVPMVLKISQAKYDELSKSFDSLAAEIKKTDDAGLMGFKGEDHALQGDTPAGRKVAAIVQRLAAAHNISTRLITSLDDPEFNNAREVFAAKYEAGAKEIVQVDPKLLKSAADENARVMLHEATHMLDDVGVTPNTKNHSEVMNNLDGGPITGRALMEMRTDLTGYLVAKHYGLDETASASAHPFAWTGFTGESFPGGPMGPGKSIEALKHDAIAQAAAMIIHIDSLAPTATRAYNPDQPRDEDGKWAATGGGSAGGGSRPLLRVSDHQLAHHISQAIRAPELNGEHLHALIHEVAARGKQFNASERGALRLGAAEPSQVNRSGDSIEKLTKTAHGASARMIDAATKPGQTDTVAHAGNIAVAAHSEAIWRGIALPKPFASPKIAPPAGETTIYGKGFTPGQINETQLHHRLQRELDNAHPDPTAVNDVVKELARRGKAIGLDGKLTNTAAVLQDSQAGPKSLAKQVVEHLKVIAAPSGYDTKLMKYNRAGMLGNAHAAAIKKGLNIDAHGTVVGNIDFARRKPAAPDSPIGVGKNLSQLNDGQLANRLNHELGGETKPNLPRVNDLMRELANRGKMIDVAQMGSKVKLVPLHEDALKNVNAPVLWHGFGARVNAALSRLAEAVNVKDTRGIKQNAAALVALHAIAKERGLSIGPDGTVREQGAGNVGKNKTFDPGKLDDAGLQAVYDVAHNGLNGVYNPKVFNKIVQAAAARGKVFVANKLRPISEAHLPDVLLVPTSVLAQGVKRAHDLLKIKARVGGFPPAPREILQARMNAAHVEALKRGLSISPDGTVHRLGAGTQLQRQIDAAQRPDTAKPATFSKNDLSKLGGNELQREFDDVMYGKPIGKYTTAVANRVNALHQEAARRNQLFQDGELIAVPSQAKQTSYQSRWIAEDVTGGHRGIKNALESVGSNLGFGEKQNIANYHAMIGRAHLKARAHNIKIDATGQIEKLPEPPPPAPEPPSHPNALKNLSATHLAQRFGKAAYGNVEGKINLGLVNRLHQEAANRGLKFDSQGMLSKVSAHPEIAALHDSTLAQRIVEANQALKGANHDASIIDAAHGKLGELHAEAANRGLKISAAGKIDASGRAVGDTAEMKQVNFHHVDLSTLHDAPITDLKSLDPGGHVNGAYAGKLHMADGSLVKVVVKPYSGLYDEDQLRKGIPMKGDLAREESASIVNEAMGKPIIMGVATQRSVPGKGKSAVIQFVPGKMPFEVYSAPPESEQRTAAMFDFVIGNKDRHSGNYAMMADNNGEYHLGLFDHGLSFPLQHSDHASEQGNTRFMDRVRGERLTAKETKALQRFLDGYPKAYERMIHAGLEPDAASGAKARAQWLLDNNRLPYSWSDVPGDGDGPSSSSTSW